MASRVILIDEGRLKYDGPVADLDPKNEGLDTVFARLTGSVTATEPGMQADVLLPAMLTT